MPANPLFRADPARRPEPLVFKSLQRALVIESDHFEVSAYLSCAYARLRLDRHDAVEADRGAIWCREGPPRVSFNGLELEFFDAARLMTPVRAAYYGSQRLFRSSFRRDALWRSVACAGLLVAGRAVIITAGRGIDRTAMTIELLSRGAGFFSDDTVFVRRSDRLAAGFPRTLLVRERHLKKAGERLRDVCRRAEPRTGSRGTKAWDFIDVGDVFGEAAIAPPAPLGAAIVVDRAEHGTAAVEPMSAALAACRLARHLNVAASAVDKIVQAAELIDGLPCFWVRSASARDAVSSMLAALQGT